MRYELLDAAGRAAERLTENHTEHTEAGSAEWPPLIMWLEQSATEVVKRGEPERTALESPSTSGKRLAKRLRGGQPRSLQSKKCGPAKWNSQCPAHHATPDGSWKR